MNRLADNPRALSLLSHPLWWTALALLLLNDHFLKSSLVLPGALTGKLSDFAGMIVAPGVAVALLGASRSRRVLAYVLAAAPFVAINLSPSAAHAFESLGASFGLTYRVWVDPTDLFALAALPLNEWMIANPVKSRPLVARVGLALGALACVATSANPAPGFIARSYVINETPEAITVRVRLAPNVTPDCDLLGDRFDEAYDPELFTNAFSYELEPGQAAPIQTSVAGAESSCGAALIDIEGLGGQLVFWDVGFGDFIPEFPDEMRPESGGTSYPTGRVGVVVDGDSVALVPGEGVDIADPLDVLETSCDHPIGKALQAGGQVPYAEARIITEIEELADGCVRIVHGELPLTSDATDPTAMPPAEPMPTDSPTRDLYLCVPMERIPFRPGDRFIATSEEGGLLLSNDDKSLRIQRTSLGVDEPSVLPSAPHLEPGSARCRGERLACGAYVQPMSLRWNGLTYGSGDMLRLSNSAETIEVFVGRAERVVLAVDGCEGREELGESYDLLISKERSE